MDDSGIELAEAIRLLRGQLIEARRQGADESIQFPVQSLTIEFQVVATRTVDGKAGFKIPIIELELGGGGQRELAQTQTVTVVFGEPLTIDGRPARIAENSDEVKG